jgi:hypothetical protein
MSQLAYERWSIPDIRHILAYLGFLSTKYKLEKTVHYTELIVLKVRGNSNERGLAIWKRM